MNDPLDMARQILQTLPFSQLIDPELIIHSGLAPHNR